MVDNLLVYKQLKENIKTKTRSALATVINVRGSAYRKEGAKMMIEESGKLVGMISGGCIEPDVKKVALHVLKTKTPVLKKYDLDEDLVWGLGLGCPGKVDVYIEPIKETLDSEDE